MCSLVNDLEQWTGFLVYHTQLVLFSWEVLDITQELRGVPWSARRSARTREDVEMRTTALVAIQAIATALCGALAAHRGVPGRLVHIELWRGVSHGASPPNHTRRIIYWLFWLLPAERWLTRTEN